MVRLVPVSKDRLKYHSPHFKGISEHVFIFS